MHETIRIVEVGPRDGLQNEKISIPLGEKLRFIERLRDAGIREIEATSFVSPKWVPQLGDAGDLWPSLPDGPLYSALVPNERGLDRALDLSVNRIAVFTAASETFTQQNINTSISGSLESFAKVIDRFRERHPAGFVRAYVSTAFECPYEGRISPQQVLDIVLRLSALDVDEISLGDTIGAAVPREIVSLTRAVESEFSLSKLAYHFHDTRGTAIANVSTAMELGVYTFDASAGGLGGCPFAPGAGGNLATEDLVYFLERSGVPTAIDLLRLAESSLEILERFGRAPSAKSQLAQLAISGRFPK